MLKLRTTTPADATLVEALTAAVKSVEREEETEVATKSSRPPRSMFCTETTSVAGTSVNAREIVTITATATRASSAPREADTPKFLAAPERERRTGITVSPSPSLPKRATKRMFCTETTYTAKTSLSAREIVTTTATAKATSSAPREADTPKSPAAPERERRTGTTVSPSPSLPKWSSRSPANAPLCAKPRVTAATTTRSDPTKMVIKKSSQCAAMCKAKGHCCNDYKIGSNQMVSCAQACEMRISGVSKQNCQNKVNEFASKKGQGGCRLQFGKKNVSLCNRCKDLDKTCPHGVQNGKAGLDGCAALVQ